MENKFVADKMTIIKPQCHSCKLYTKGTLTCIAFPDGIPQAILLNNVDHFTTHVEGDHGVLGVKD